MKYMLMIYSNEQSWAGLSDAERAALAAGHESLTKELVASGHFVQGAGLAGEEHTRTVRVRSDRVLATDGPYVESKEHLAGFYVVECATHRDAVAIAARLPDAAVNFIEVRPVVDPC